MGGGRALHVDSRITASRGGDERLRWIDGENSVGSDPVYELGCEGARPAADIQHALSGSNARQVGELR